MTEQPCTCLNFTGPTAMGWTRRTADGLWVHAGCGRPSAATIEAQNREDRP